MIKLRVLGEDWDNVIPCALSDVGLRKGSTRPQRLVRKKSKLGLGELYEQEYIKKAMRLDGEAEEK